MACALLAACSRGTVVSAPAPAGSEFRVHESASGKTISFDELAKKAAGVDLVFFGEQHDDPETHFAEFALLEAIGRVRSNVVVSLEMFERDVQPLLDGYLGGTVTEAAFLAGSRPWERYATDYRSLVQLARARKWPVVASNVPRPIANAVSRRGLVALDSLPPASRAHVAREIICPKDQYYERFAEQMRGHGGPATAANADAARATTDRFYEAQCIKDETMGESIAASYARAGSGAIVVHYNGAFHSDYTYGTAARALRRLPKASRLVITAVPVADLASADPSSFAERADYVIFTRKPVAK